MIEGDRMVNPNVTADDQTRLTTEYTRRAVRRSSNEPEAGRSSSTWPTACRTCRCSSATSSKASPSAGLFGDVIIEIDWSVGQVLETLRRLKLDEQHAGDLHSDNGPWLSYGDHAGSACAARGQGHDVRRRLPRAVRDALAGPHPRRLDLPRAGRHSRYPADDRRAGRREARSQGRSTGSTSCRCWKAAPAEDAARSLPFYWRELQAASGPWKTNYYPTIVTPGAASRKGGKRRPGCELSDLAKDVEERNGRRGGCASGGCRAAQGPWPKRCERT